MQKLENYTNLSEEEFADLPQTKRLKALKAAIITPRQLQQNKIVRDAEKAKALLMTAAKHGMGTFQKGATKRSFSLIKQ